MLRFGGIVRWVAVWVAAAIVPLAASLVAATFVAFAGVAKAEELERYEFTQAHMGMPFTLLFYAPDEETANRAATAAFARVKYLNTLLSDYAADSELSRLSATSGQGRSIPVSDELWFVLRSAQSLSGRTSGAFDVTVGPYVRLWRQARRGKRMPALEQFAVAKAAVGYQFVRLDEEHQTAELLRPGMRLDLGGIAAGYAADEALRVLAEEGVTRALVNASGDVAINDPPPNATGWKIGVTPPAANASPIRFLLLSHIAITTAGDAAQGVEIDGKRYSHIVDPQTGLGLTQSYGVTVIAPKCIDADSLDTAISVLGPDRGLKLIAETPGAEVIVMHYAEGKLDVRESPGVKAFEMPEHPSVK